MKNSCSISLDIYKKELDICPNSFLWCRRGDCLSWIIDSSKFLYSVLFVLKHKQSLHQTFHHNSSVRLFCQQIHIKKFARISCEQLDVLANFLSCNLSLTSLLSKSAEPPKGDCNLTYRTRLN